MEMIWRTSVSTLMLFLFLRYFNNPPTPPNPLLLFFLLSSILFLLIIDSNRSVSYEETEDFYVLYTFEEDRNLGGEIINENRECCNITRYYFDDDDDCFGYYDGYHEVDNDGCIWNDDEDYSQWNQDGGDDGIENHDDDDNHAHGDDDDDDTLTSRIEDYIANVYNGWREERRTENVFV